jgi:Fructose-bisphosphate aldolase class-I/Bacterial fructose-1,6-bisphosphatase, glpX-encoded
MEKLVAPPAALGKEIAELRVVVLDKPRHVESIERLRRAGASVTTPSDGDVAGALEALDRLGSPDGRVARGECARARALRAPVPGGRHRADHRARGLMDGEHTIDRSEEVTTAVLRTVFDRPAEQRVVLEGIVLKPNMLLAGYDCAEQARVEEVAERTLGCFRRVVPAAVPGIAFLSGGQSDDLAAAHLSAMNTIAGVPWELTLSYGRALVGAPLRAWSGDNSGVAEAQAAFLHRARCNAAARRGEYAESMEHALVS